MKVGIINIGDEILIGQIVNTNSNWMAEKMTAAGYEVEEIVTIGDGASQIKSTLDDVLQRVDIVLITGGLGPTKDDITKKTLCEYLGTTLVFDDAVLENIEQILSNRKVLLNGLTRDQAYVPKGCTVIQNRVGTAPIMWFDYKGKVIVSMPGVPYEMKYAMDNEVINRLQQQFKTETYLKKVYLVGGYSESALAIHLTEFEDNLPEGFGLAYLPSARMMRLRLFVRNDERKAEFAEQAKKLEERLGDAILAKEDIPLEQLLGQRLLQKGLTLATAESCTGGNIAHLITSISGASAYFKGAVVSYTNDVKANVLHVPQDILDKYGAVSKEVVEAMARGVQDALDTDCAIAVSGIAGPDGGTPELPVGTVWIATAVNDKIESRLHQMGMYREANISGASTLGMLQLLEHLSL